MGILETNDGTGLADFRPPPIPQFTKLPAGRDDNNNANAGYKPASPIPAVSKIAAENDLGMYTNFRQVHEPSAFFKPVQHPTEKDRVLEKLNYLVHMMEAYQLEKTDNVIEELVLYSFLGVFIIFICDAFVRIGGRNK